MSSLRMLMKRRVSLGVGTGRSLGETLRLPLNPPSRKPAGVCHRRRHNELEDKDIPREIREGYNGKEIRLGIILPPYIALR